jgi:hypothetical protein
MTNRLLAEHPDAVRGPEPSSGLRKSAWWCLASWPVAFIAVIVIGEGLYPPDLRGGARVSYGTGWDAVFNALFVAMLVGPPLASLVLSAVDFRRTRLWRALIPAFTLLALIVGWDVLKATSVANWADVNWWVFSPTVLVAFVIGEGLPTGPAGGEQVSHGTVWDTVFKAFLVAMLVGPPLASLVLCAVDFRRTRVWRALIPAFTLLVLIVGWDVLAATSVANWADVNWWVLSPTVLVAVVIGSAVAWPSRSTEMPPGNR